MQYNKFFQLRTFVFFFLLLTCGSLQAQEKIFELKLENAMHDGEFMKIILSKKGDTFSSDWAYAVAPATKPALTNGAAFLPVDHLAWSQSGGTWSGPLRVLWPEKLANHKTNLPEYDTLDFQIEFSENNGVITGNYQSGSKNGNISGASHSPESLTGELQYFFHIPLSYIEKNKWQTKQRVSFFFTQNGSEFSNFMAIPGSPKLSDFKHQDTANVLLSNGRRYIYRSFGGATIEIENFKVEVIEQNEFRVEVELDITGTYDQLSMGKHVYKGTIRRVGTALFGQCDITYGDTWKSQFMGDVWKRQTPPNPAHADYSLTLVTRGNDRLDLRMYFQTNNGVFQPIWAEAPEYNKKNHEITSHSLSLENGRLTGDVTIKLAGDSNIPGNDDETCSFTLDGSLTDVIEGTFETSGCLGNDYNGNLYGYLKEPSSHRKNPALQGTPEPNQAFRQQARQEAQIVLHPGGENRTFWTSSHHKVVPEETGNPNEFDTPQATEFIYAPSLEFDPVDEAVKYSFSIDGTNLKFDSPHSWASLDPIWSELEPGQYKLKVSGINNSGNPVGGVQEREFRKKPSFLGPYAYRSQIDYSQSAYRHAKWIETYNRPSAFQGDFFSYMPLGPTSKAGDAWATISYSIVRLHLGRYYSTTDPAEKKQALEKAKNIYYWARRGPRAAHDLTPNNRQWLYNTVWVGINAMDLYDATGDAVWLERARHTLSGLSKIQGEFGSWSWTDDDTGEFVGGRTSNGQPFHTFIPSSALLLYGRYRHASGNNEFIPYEDKAMQYMRDTTLVDFWWHEQESHGHPGSTPISPKTAVNFSKYMLDYAREKDRDLDLVAEIARWCEDQFVYWDHAHMKGPTPGVMHFAPERETMAASAAMLAEVFWRLHRETDDMLWLAKAEALAQGIVASQDAVTGGFLTNSGDTDHYRPYWSPGQSYFLTYPSLALYQFGEYLKTAGPVGIKSRLHPRSPSGLFAQIHSGYRNQIHVSIYQPSRVVVQLMDLQGRKVSTIFTGFKEPGRHVFLPGPDSRNGISLVRVKVNGNSLVKRIVH